MTAKQVRSARWVLALAWDDVEIYSSPDLPNVSRVIRGNRAYFRYHYRDYQTIADLLRAMS